MVYPGHKRHQQTCDVRLKGKRIAEIGKTLKDNKGDRVIQAKGMMLFPSLVDMQCAVGEPGFEYKENIQSAASAASVTYSNRMSPGRAAERTSANAGVPTSNTDPAPRSASRTR